MIEAAVEEHPNVPIAIHLDHGPDFETCKKCVDAGFTSVMFDGSKYDFEENINKQFKNTLQKLFPLKLIPVMIELSGIPQDKKCAQAVPADSSRRMVW